MKLIRVGVDLAKNVFQVHGVDRNEKAVWRRKLTRESWLKVLREAVEPGCEIGMESCGGAHHWARRLQAHGFKVRLVAPQFVKPYVKSNKNDANDAEAICTAVVQPNMRFVSIKSVEQQALLGLHRVRQGLIEERTASTNRLRGVLAEFGVVLPQSAAVLQRALPALLADDGRLPPLVQRSLQALLEHLRDLDSRIAEFDRAIAQHARSSASAQRLGALSGVGPLTASAVVATVGNAQDYRNGRQFAAWLGLVPRQYSSGGKIKLGRIPRRGDAYLRALLIQGARSALQAALRRAPARRDRLSAWIVQLAQRVGYHKTLVAIANMANLTAEVLDR